MKKLYEDFKMINVNEIEGARLSIKDNRVKDAIIRAENNIIKYGIKSSFEVIKSGNKYKLIAGRLHFIAAKNLGYEIVPCLIRNRFKEAVLFKILKNIA